MTDLVIGLAANYDWPAVEPFAVSLVRSGYQGHKVLFIKNLTPLAQQNLLDLGFSLIDLPLIDFSDPNTPVGNYFAYVGRFILIHQFLHENPGYRFVVCADTRDVVFQHDPMKWLEKNIEDSALVAASEHIRHCDQEGNTAWINQGFREVSSWMLPQDVYCSGLISGRAEYVSDLALGIYLMGRHISGSIWGADQPVYNAIMHQKAYADITKVPKMRDLYCLNMVVLAFEKYRRMMTDLPPVTAFTDIKIQDEDVIYTLPDLRDFSILHQYDRIPPFANRLRAEYCLANIDKPSSRRPL